MKKITRVAITGGPCCGKTTLLNALADMSYTTIPEAARMVIEEEQKRGSNCVPWIDLYGFQESAANRILELEGSFDSSLLFCDRGVVDGHGYATNGKVQTPNIVRDSGVRRYGAVFILDPIPAYKKDESRKENPEEARKIHQAIWNAYREFGYNPVRIPLVGGPSERANYFIKQLEKVL